MPRDEEKTPVEIPPGSAGRVATKRRLQTATERELESDRARRERAAEASGEIDDNDGGVAYEVPEDITGQYEGDELEMQRSKRPTDERIAHLEKKHDRLVRGHQKLAESMITMTDSVGKVSTAVGELRGEMKIIPELVSVLRDAATAKNEREKITLTATVGVDTAKAMEPLEAKRALRQWVTSVIAILSTVTVGILAIFKAKGC